MMNWNKHGNKNSLAIFFWIFSGKLQCKFNKWTKYTKIPNKNFDPTKSMVQIRLHNFNVCLNLFIANDWLKAIAEQQYIDTKYQNRIQQIVRQSVVIHACIRRLSVYSIFFFLHTLFIVAVVCVWRAFFAFLFWSDTFTPTGVCVSGFVCFFFMSMWIVFIVIAHSHSYLRILFSTASNVPLYHTHLTPLYWLYVFAVSAV